MIDRKKEKKERKKDTDHTIIDDDLKFFLSAILLLCIIFPFTIFFIPDVLWPVKVFYACFFWVLAYFIFMILAENELYEAEIDLDHATSLYIVKRKYHP